MRRGLAFELPSCQEDAVEKRRDRIGNKNTGILPIVQITLWFDHGDARGTFCRPGAISETSHRQSAVCERACRAGDRLQQTASTLSVEANATQRRQGSGLETDFVGRGARQDGCRTSW